MTGAGGRTDRRHALAREVVPVAGRRVGAHRTVSTGDVYVVGVRIRSGVLPRLEAVRAGPDRAVVDHVLKVGRTCERPCDDGFRTFLTNHDVDRVHDVPRIRVVIGVPALMLRVADPADQHAREAVLT